MDEYGINIGKEPIKVNHSDLTLANPETSLYRAKCPACKTGLLLMRRNQQTVELEEIDFCIVCGQMIIYEDINELRKREKRE